jgi:hypothetical protein
MDNVLPFPRDGRRSGAATSARTPNSATEAEILLFTGVRYERHPEASLGRDDSPTPPRRKSRRRA